MIKLPHILNDRFKLVKNLGEGSFSEVYLADDLDPSNGQDRVALKLFKQREQAAHDDEQSLSSFEFQMLARLRHPNLAAVYDYGVDADSSRYFFTMEYLEGDDFLTATEDLRPIQLLPYIVATCRALHHIHVRGIIHHDLKPANLMVLESPDRGQDLPAVKLTDFGLARSLLADDDGLIRGTPDFIAPEILEGNPADHRCDLYSLGVLLYLCISGYLPDRATGNSTRGGNTTPLKTRTGEPTPAVLEDVIQKLLRHNPDRRYGSANEVIHDLGLYTGTRFTKEPGTVGGSTIADGTILTLRPKQIAKLKQDLEILASGRRPQRPICMIRGPEGAGKTHLVMELRKIAQTSGAGFLVAGPSVEDVGTEKAAGEWVDSNLRRLESIRKNQKAGIVLALDARMIDPRPISRLLEDLQRSRKSLNIYCLVTLEEATSASNQLLAAFPNRVPARHLRLRPLTRGGIARMVSSLLGKKVGARDPLARRVQLESDGIPLFVEDVVNHLMKIGCLRETSMGLRYDDRRFELDFSLPHGKLLDHHKRKMADTSPPALSALAHWGTPATAAMITSLLRYRKQGSGTVSAQLQQAVHSRTISTEEDESGDVYYAFRSHLSGNLLRQAMPEKSRQRTHLRAARDIESRNTIQQTGEPSPRLWLHLLHGGKYDRAWEEGLKRAEWLALERRREEAAELCRSLLKGPGADDVQSGLAWRLRSLLADQERAAGRMDEALDLLQQAQDYAGDAGDPTAAASVRLALGKILERRGSFDEAVDYYRKALDEVPPRNHVLRGDLQLQLSTVSLQLGRFEDVSRFRQASLEAYKKGGSTVGRNACRYQEAFTHYRKQKFDLAAEILQKLLDGSLDTEDPLSAGRTRVLLGSILYQQNRFADASRLFEQALKQFKTLGERDLEAFTLANLGAITFEKGIFSEAGQYNLRCLRVHEDVGNRYGQALSHYNLGVCHYHRGRYRLAQEHLRMAVSIYQYLDDPQGLAMCCNMAAELHLSIGDHTGAADRLDESSKAIDRADPGLAAADCLLLEAELAMESDDPGRAEELSRRSAKIFDRLSDQRQVVRTDLMLTRALAAAGRTEEALAAFHRAQLAALELPASRLKAEVLLVGSLLKLEYGLGPEHEECITGCRLALVQLTRMEDPDFKQRLHAALGSHLLACGEERKARRAYHRAFALLREIASQFGSDDAGWKTDYLSNPHRAMVVHLVADWNRNRKSAVKRKPVRADKKN